MSKINILEEFDEYMSRGYDGGETGLRCDECDWKYSGTPSYTQLCPKCKANKIISELLEDQKKEIISKVGMLRQLVGESNENIPDWVYKELDKIAPLMTEEQKEEFEKNNPL